MSNSSWILGAIALVMALLIMRQLLGGGKMPATTVLEKIKVWSEDCRCAQYRRV